MFEIEAKVKFDEHCDEDALEKAIVHAARDRIVGNLESNIQTQILKDVREIIMSKIDVIISESFAEKLYQTNKWGERTGEETTLKEHIIQRFEEYKNESVDSRGRPDSGRGTTKRIDYVINAAIEETVNSLVREHTLEIVKQIDDEFKRQITEAVENTVLTVLNKMKKS